MFINSNFNNNSASRDGGAIRMYSGNVKNCNFANNTAQYGGAIEIDKTGTVTNSNLNT